MANTKKHRRKKNRTHSSTGSVVERSQTERAAPSVPAGRVASRPSLQNAAFALMVTLGCLGLAVFFTFFYSEDANHFLYGGVMALTALGWLVIATRRWSAYRQRART